MTKRDMLWHTKPSDCTPAEAAVAMMLAADAAAAERLGIDPTTIHVSVEFKKTGHKLCFGIGEAPSRMISGGGPSEADVKKMLDEHGGKTP